MKKLNFVQLVCICFDHPCSMMPVHHGFMTCSDRKSANN